MDKELHENKIKILLIQLSKKYNLPVEEIKEIISSPYKFSKETITNIDFDKIKTEEDFNSLKKNFIFPHIGKIYANYNIFKNKLKEENGD